ncbi:MAG: hypothetical protein JSS02_06185 [Planctomycetes bacterium]|nr:hypothetical protein [Planctomycetota bacterium]
MKRIFVVAFIVGYIGILTFGNVCHLLQYGVSSHPLMYMIVWDMFCGWSAYDMRVKIIAEGESETYYDLTKAPWGELHAYGYIGREHYDHFNSHSGAIAQNVLKHTCHEPIVRVIVLDECWTKKLNLPDSVWNLRYDMPKDWHTYYHVRTVMLPDGTVTKRNDCFLTHQGRRMAYDNPRLVQQSLVGRPMFLSEPGAGVSGESAAGLPGARLPVASPSAN